MFLSEVMCLFDFYIDKDSKYVPLGKRNHQVSVRLPKAVYDVICSYHGRNFSDKLVNFVIDYALSK